MDPWSEYESVIDYSYSFRGGGSINHPSVDNLSSYSLISDNNNSHHYHSSRGSNTVEKSKRSKKGKQQRLDQRPRASSQPVVETTFLEGTHGNSRSFGSEPTPNTKRRYANNSLSTYENSRSASSFSFSDHQSKRFEDVLSDSPSETRLRIEKSLSNIREQQARSISRPSTLSKSSELYDDDEINDEINDTNKHEPYHEHEYTTPVTNKYTVPKEEKETRKRNLIRKMSQPELNANYHAWETNFQKKTMDAMDERYKQVTASLESRIKMLEEEMQKANDDMEVSREYVSQIQEKSNRIDNATQTSIQSVQEKLDLIDYATQTSIQSIQEKPDLINYATQTSIQSIQAKPDLIDYATQTSIQTVEEKPDLMDYGTQTSIQGVHQISDLEAKSKNIELIETMLNDLGFNSMDDFKKAMKDWRTKARLFDQVQYFIDRVDNVVWDTPYTSLLSICRQHKNLVSSMRNSPDDVCENHRTQYEKALLEAERDKNRALGSSPYSSEHLDVTFERLVRWAHTVRHVTS